jgi:hypothetical protein
MTMRQAEVQIGGDYRVRIGDRLALVTVQRRKDGRGRARFVCLTHDTRREVTATAARLRPLPGTAEAAAQNRRRTAAAAARAPRPFTGSPGERMIEAAPVPGMLARVGSSPVAALSAANADYVRRIVDGVHVAESFAHVARVVRRKIGRSIIFRSIPRALRRGLLHAAAERHAAGRRMYRAAMGHDPLPSPRMVADAVGIAAGIGACPR